MKINLYYPQLMMKVEEMTKMQVKNAKFVQKNPQEVVKLSISDFVALTGLKSESTIVRFYRIREFSGYHEFKMALSTEIAGKSYHHTYSDLTDNNTVHNIKEKIFKGMIKNLHEYFTYLRHSS